LTESVGVLEQELLERPFWNKSIDATQAQAEANAEVSARGDNVGKTF